MSGFHRIVPCAAIAALVFSGGSESPARRLSKTAGRSRWQPQDALPAALDRVDAMLTSGELDISRCMTTR